MLTFLKKGKMSCLMGFDLLGCNESCGNPSQGVRISITPPLFLTCPKRGFTHSFRSHCSISGWDLVKQKLSDSCSPGSFNPKQNLLRCPLLLVCDKISASVPNKSHLHFFCPCVAEKGHIWDAPAEKSKQADPQLHGAGFGDGGRGLFH